MRLLLSALGLISVGVAVIVLHRRAVRVQTPSLVADLARWHQSMPLPKPRQVYSGTQPVDRKALARALKGQKAKRETPRRLRIVPDDKRRIG